MKRWLKRIEKEDGQTTVEFVLMTIMVMFLVFLFFQASVTFMTTQYVKYATFMGARTLAVIADREAARAVVNSYLGANMEKLKPWAYIDAGEELVKFPAPGTVRVNYSSLFYLPMLGEGAESSGARTPAEAKPLEITVETTMKRDVFQCIGPGFDNKTLGGC